MKSNMIPNSRKADLMDIDGQISVLLANMKNTLRLLAREVHEHPRDQLSNAAEDALDTSEFLAATASELLEELTAQIATRGQIEGVKA